MKNACNRAYVDPAKREVQYRSVNLCLSVIQSAAAWTTRQLWPDYDPSTSYDCNCEFAFPNIN